MPKITVIVPIYNSSKYLRRCVDSLLRQSFTDWECLLIDDGSTDDSFEVCEDIVRTDKRLKLFHIPNSGVSVARNIGLEMVAGEWISFVDSDDWLEHDTYEYAISQAEEHKADIIQWQFHYEPYISEPKGFIKTPQELKLKKSVALAFWKNACWGQLVKTELVKKNKIKFPEHITVGEDRFFCYCCYSCATRIWQLPNTFYHYYQSEDSLMNKNFSIKKIEDDAKSLAMTETYMLEKREVYFDIKNENKKYVF